MESTNPAIQSILSNGVATLGFVQVSVFLGFSKQAAYTSRAPGNFPVRIRKIGKRLIVLTSDLVTYLETGESQSSHCVVSDP